MKFLEMIQSLQLLIQNEISMIRKNVLVFRMTEVGCILDQSHIIYFLLRFIDDFRDMKMELS